MERKENSSSVPSPKGNLARAFYSVNIAPMIARAADVGCVWFHFGTRKRRGTRLGEGGGESQTEKALAEFIHFAVISG